MRILIIISGEYGRRHVENITKNGPAEWQVETWQAPSVLPLVVDYPEDYLPESMPSVDLVVSFAELKGVAELLPDIVLKTGALAVLAPVDNEAWLPRGLARQLRGWLANMNVPCATPKPLCSLTEYDYSITLQKRLKYESPEISTFAKYFGRPKLSLTVDENTHVITAANVERDAVCGCAHFVAEGLIGVSVDEAEEKAGLLHHHYPCLASMVKDPDYNMDTLMHASGNIIKDDVGLQIKTFKRIRYIAPGKRSD